jgi:hypothetical protein
MIIARLDGQLLHGTAAAATDIDLPYVSCRSFDLTPIERHL